MAAIEMDGKAGVLSNCCRLSCNNAIYEIIKISRDYFPIWYGFIQTGRDIERQRNRRRQTDKNRETETDYPG